MFWVGCAVESATELPDVITGLSAMVADDANDRPTVAAVVSWAGNATTTSPASGRHKWGPCCDCTKTRPNGPRSGRVARWVNLANGGPWQRSSSSGIAPDT